MTQPSFQFAAGRWLPDLITYQPWQPPQAQRRFFVRADFGGEGTVDGALNTVFANFGGEGSLTGLVGPRPQFAGLGTLRAGVVIGMENVTPIPGPDLLQPFGGEGFLQANVAVTPHQFYPELAGSGTLSATVTSQ